MSLCGDLKSQVVFKGSGGFDNRPKGGAGRRPAVRLSGRLLVRLKRRSRILVLELLGCPGVGCLGSAPGVLRVLRVWEVPGVWEVLLELDVWEEFQEF